jgi:hypothetical protein
MSFRNCAHRYIADRRDGWKNANHAQQWPTTLERYAFEKIGDQAVGAIDTGMVVGVFETDLVDET